MTFSKHPLALAMASLALSAPVFAQKTITLEAVTVATATKTDRALDQSTVSVDVITEDDIQAMNAVTLKDIFLQYPSVFVNPGQGEMSIRGAGAKGTLILLDGRRMSSEFTKNYDGNRIPASSIERIEIVKGPSSVLYGSDALGGVVNIITKNPTKEGIEGSVAASSGANEGGKGFRTNLEADVRGKSGDTGFSAWLSVIDTQPYYETEKVNPRVPAGNAGGQVAPSQSNLRVSPTGQMSQNPAHVTIGSKIANQYDTTVSYKDPARVINLGGKLEQKLSSSVKVGAEVMLMKETIDASMIADNYVSNYTRTGNTNFPVFLVPMQQSLENTRFDTVVRASWQATTALSVDWRSYRSFYEKKETQTTPLWKALGYSSQSASAALSGNGDVEIWEHDLTTRWKPNAQHQLLAGVERRDENRTAAFFDSTGKMSSKNQDFTAVYAQHEWQVTPALGIVYGARHDRVSIGDEATSGSVGANYRFSDLAKLRASYSQGFRTPDMQELFINRFNPQGRRFVGAEVVDASIGKQAFSLKPERSQNMEMGLSGKGQGWNYDLALFHNTIQDSIQRITTPTYLSFRNESEVTLHGLDAKLGVDVTPKLRINTAYTWLNSHSKTTDQRLQYTPEQLASFSAVFKPTQAWRLTVMAQYVGEQDYTDTRVNPQVGKTTDSYTPVHLKASYMPTSMKDTEFFGGVDNVFDAKLDRAIGYNVGPYTYIGVRQFF
ncbi:MAG: TonB-dependent receptor [Gammaproteobacteria bacterium]|nr:TonB-dependent receptor [Gammaproteobacteria bacterium]